MKFRSAFAVLSMTVALAACGNLPFQQEEKAEEQPGHVGPPAVSPLEQPIETGSEARPVATAEASTMGTAMFRASGSGWAVSAADRTAVYERPGAKSVGITVRRLTYGKGVEFVGNMNGSVFALNIRAQECEAGGQKTPFSANLRVGSQRMSGCAAPTDSMPKAQVRASSAAPKPKAQPKPAAAPAPKPAEASGSPATPTPATPTPATPATAAPSGESPASERPETTGTGTAPAATAVPAVTPAPVEAPAAATPASEAGDAPSPAESPAAEAAAGAASGATAPILPPAPQSE